MSVGREQEQLMLERARAAKGRAYAPYSKFHVGAALRCADGSVFDGCNVENASYPAGTCAERVALGAAVVAGHREFTVVAIATDASTATPPCGICRQALAEFAPSLTVVAIDATGLVTRWTLNDLLPHPFTPASLHN
jgi:cytidine deaminase